MSKKNRNKSQVTAPTQEVEKLETDVVEETVVDEPEVTELEQVPAVAEAEATEENPDGVVPDEEEVETEDVSEATPVAEEVVEPAEPEKEVEEIRVQDEPVAVEKEVVVKPVINKGILKVEKRVSTKAAVTIPQTEGVLKFNAIAKKYIDLMGTGKIDEDARRRALIVLSNMCNFICTTNDPAVFDTCLRFFMENRSIMLAQSTVTAGIEKAVEKSKIAKILQFYVVFQTLVESKLLNSRFTLNITTIRRLLGNDALANWLIAKRG